MTSPSNLDKYRHHVERFGMPEEQRMELLRTVWHIMEIFIDRALGNDAVQIGAADCFAKRASGVSPVLYQIQLIRPGLSRLLHTRAVSTHGVA